MTGHPFFLLKFESRRGILVEMLNIEVPMTFTAPVRPPHTFIFEATFDYYHAHRMNPNSYLKLWLDSSTRTFPLKHAELFTFSAIDQTRANASWLKQMSASWRIVGESL